jgi:DNA repair protein RadC
MILKHFWNEDKINLIEEFKVLFLNRANRVLQIFTASQGGVTGTVADPRIILGVALKVGACVIFLAHNHPSGSLKPSMADEELTKKIREAAKYHDIKVVDHIILNDESYFSFADDGLM